MLVDASAGQDLANDFAVEKRAVAGFGDGVEWRLKVPFDLSVGPDPSVATLVEYVSVETAKIAEGD